MSKIPIYQVIVPEYKFKVFKKDSKKINYPGTPWFNLKIPQVYYDNKPDFEYIGTKIDNCLKRHFLGKKVAIRVLSSKDHKTRTFSQIITTIKKLGHDRYDPNIKGDRYENIDNHHIDFFALDFKIEYNKSYFKDLLEPFYYWPLYDRGKPIRIDIAIIYDLSKLKIVEHRYKGRENELKKDGFVFKYPNNKPNSILGIIKIL
jgi:hypothetical protein